MGNGAEVSEHTWYPHGEPAPPSISRRAEILSSVISMIVMVLVLIGLGAVFDVPVLDKWFLVIGPLLGAMLGSYIRDRRAEKKTSGGLYPVQVRFARKGARRWRRMTALSTPGLILCRSRRAENDLELRVTGIDHPRSASPLTQYVVTGAPTSVMKVHVEGGSAELRGRPDHLHALAVGAALPHAA